MRALYFSSLLAIQESCCIPALHTRFWSCCPGVEPREGTVGAGAPAQASQLVPAALQPLAVGLLCRAGEPGAARGPLLLGGDLHS